LPLFIRISAGNRLPVRVIKNSQYAAEKIFAAAR
jgi:hypothetical protein